ncbi:MAG TPA: T9SS type A sorting domain-containing protein [Bacteroidales bacterium]|nr:T9SS type A sorting domain-containing protein [Bacteroidales bacterium]
MRNKRLTYLSIFILTTVTAGAQEVVTGLLSNRKLSEASLHVRPKGAMGADTLALPFSDDFSYSNPFPSSEKWTDNKVFINNTFSVNQVTQGVATFDCLDEYGKLYDEASTALFTADILTSRPLDLSYAPADSIYMSFFYEAGGNADMPERDDSLTLSFWAPSEERWYSVWRARGEATGGFRQVMIAVKDQRWLRKGFQFRFTNYASLAGIVTEPSQAGNADQWNIDYVRLSAGRSVSDTVIHDAALTKPLRSLLKDYESMPWRQFRQAYLSVMSSTAGIYYRNNDNIVRNVTRHITIKDVINNFVVRDFSAGATNVDPFTNMIFNAPLLYTYSSLATDSALFLVTSSLITDDFDPKGNDTLTYLQKFTDYFAIDDGTAEAGYGINGQGSRNAMVALRFRSFTADSVTSITICFNDAYNNSNQRSFDLMVWADNNGVPGALLGTTTGPVASPGTVNNGFVTWLFDKPVSVNGNFWIGWKQLSETFLNAGLDLNTPPAGRQYFLLNGLWQQSQAPGTVMMRAVMKGAGTGTSSEEGTLLNNFYRLYPNPAAGEVTLTVSDDAPRDFTIDIYDLRGARVISLPRTEHPDISRLPAGSYMMIIRNRTGIPLTLLRFIKTNR